MRYISTRHGSQGEPAPLSFEDVMLAGLARDGGLYVPVEWPQVSRAELASWRGLPYAGLALRVVRLFTGDAFAEDELKRAIDEACAAFDAPDVAPLVPLGGGMHLLELFHGPTLAFKDVALQLLPRLLDLKLRSLRRRATIVGATSGDTGPAAIEGVRGRATLEIFMLHPRGRTSEVQRRQMTTVLAPNVHNVAVEGTFDDCQDMAKACFVDLPFRDRHDLTAVNSINFARIVAQIVYYFHAALKLGAPDRSVAFCVPTGNFGNVYAGYAAMRMGLPVAHFSIASNSNDILARLLATGRMATAAVEPTLSPSMDIQISSNFERLLFELFDRDGRALAAAMAAFRRDGAMDLGERRAAELRSLFEGGRVDDSGTLAAIAEARSETGLVLDPHTAVGWAVAKRTRRDPAVPMVVLATAHPAKFPDAVARAIGERPALPARLADLPGRAERFDVLPADAEALKRLIDGRAAGAPGRRA